MSSLWTLFGLATVAATDSGVRYTKGSVHSGSPDCQECRNRLCLKSDAPVGTVQECRFGFHHFRIDNSTVAVGFVANDATQSLSKRARSRLRKDKDVRLSNAALANALNAIRQLPAGTLEDAEARRRVAIREMMADPSTSKHLADSLRREFAEVPLQQGHDFMQFVKLIKGHVESLLLESDPEADVQSAAESHLHEGAIFFATELMLAKINSLAYLQEANRAFGKETTFRLHPMILKYVRIYSWQARAKKVHIDVCGESYGQVRYTSEAVGVVVHSLLDNMVKYAPASSNTQVLFRENHRFIEVFFIGPGPKIHTDEDERIFQQGFRGRSAKETFAEGMGVGLASARVVSDQLGLDLSFEQKGDSLPGTLGLYETTFRVKFELAD